MDDPDQTPLGYYDRHIGQNYVEPAGPGCLMPLDLIGFLAPVWLFLLGMAIGAPLIAAQRDAESSGHYAAALAFYGGLGAAYLMVPWGGAYLLARVASLFVGGRAILWTGFAGVILSLLSVASGVLTGVSAWASLLIAIPSLSAMISAAIRMRAEH